LTPATAPRHATPAYFPVYYVGLLAYALWRRTRGGPRSVLPWTFWLATNIVRTITERRAWNRAYAGTRGG
jgi:hypothetical protein